MRGFEHRELGKPWIMNILIAVAAAQHRLTASDLQSRADDIDPDL
jgi:hypothetical protein